MPQQERNAAPSAWTASFAKLQPSSRKGSQAILLGEYLTIALQANQKLEKNVQDEDSLKAYNYAVARAVELALQLKLAPDFQPIPVLINGRSCRLVWKADRSETPHPNHFDYIAADTVKTGGRYFKEQNMVPGIGAAFIARAKRKSKPGSQGDVSIKYRGITAVIGFSAKGAILSFHTPMEQPTVQLGSKTWILAEDFTTPIAIFMKDNRPQKLGLVRLLRPEKYLDTAALTPLQPYDAKRIPVIFVHGLNSTPATWVPMFNALRMNPEIRERYQFWVFSYPSGYPYPYSAALLRKELEAMRQQHPDHLPIVLIGHSMGSLISRLMVTDVGDKLWVKYFGESSQQTGHHGASTQVLKDSLVFHSRKDVSRAIFIAGPHRGSEIAIHPIGRFVTKLIRAPKLLDDFRETLLSLATADSAGIHVKNLPNSIDTLSPQNPFVTEIQQHPISSRVTYHSIIGDRGKGNSPNSSDGVVPYWSSHLDGAASERIVPHGHGAHQSPEAIAEVERILLEML